MSSPARWLVSLLFVLATALASTASAQAPVEGRDYFHIADGEPWQPLRGQIEVVEIFSYACHICDEFRPMLKDWERRLPDDVRISHVPATYRSTEPFATAFFAAQAIGEYDNVHAATFDAVHRRGLLARNATVTEITAFYERLGVDRTGLVAAMENVATARQLEAARIFLQRSGARGTPTIIINGKFRVQGRTLGDVLRISDQLIAAERGPAGPDLDSTRTLPEIQH